MANTETRSRNATAAKAANTAKSAAKDATDAAFTQPKFEVPEMVRSFAEQGLSQSREAYGRMKAATEEAGELMEESFESTRDSMREVQFKALDVAQANAEATFDFARKLLGVTSVAEAMQLQASFARERFEAFVDYSKDMQSTLTKVGTEAAKPAKALFERAMTQTKS